MPTTAEEEAVAALRASRLMEQQMPSTPLSEDRLRVLLRDAVADGVASVLSEEAMERFWGKGLEVLQRQAQMKAGKFLLSGIGAMLKKAAWIGLFVLAVYSVGGWSLVKTAWAALMKG